MDEILTYVVVGFLAQLIDGVLGMAGGVSATTFLLSVGVTPTLASASVHIASLFTTSVSGLSHLRFGNVDKQLFKRLVIPGALGGALGAFLLTAVSTEIVQPLVALYLLVMGARIVRKALWKFHTSANPIGEWITPLGGLGGFFDALGGGGWGPIVTSTLVANGATPHLTIGSVNFAEAFVTVAEAAVFVLTLGLTLMPSWQIIVGLLIGGVIAAPLGAYLCKRMPTRVLMGIVGAAIVLLSLRTIWMTVGL
jgi:uncharacterized membrane protein YfcA